MPTALTIAFQIGYDSQNILGTKSDKRMDFMQILGLVAGLCTSGSILPQVITTIKKKKASDVSIFMFIVMLTGNALWIVYGISKSDIAVISTNVLALILNIMMLILKIRYKENE